MGLEIIINVAREETRVAVLDRKVLTDLYIDRVKHRDYVGNVYKGKVVKVRTFRSRTATRVSSRATLMMISNPIHSPWQIGVAGPVGAHVIHHTPLDPSAVIKVETSLNKIVSTDVVSHSARAPRPPWRSRWWSRRSSSAGAGCRRSGRSPSSCPR